MPHEETIDVLAYLRRVAKFLLPALVIGLVVGGALAVKGWSAKPVYNEKAHVLVLPQPTTSEAQATQQSQLIPMMMRTYVALEDAPALTQAVSRATDGKWTPQQVASDMTIYWGGGSALLAFQATGSSRDDADQLANTSAQQFVQLAAHLVPASAVWQPRLVVVEQSVEMTAPSGGRTKAMELAIGATVATTLLAAVLLEMLSGLRRRRRGAAPAKTVVDDKPGRGRGRGATATK